MIRTPSLDSSIDGLQAPSPRLSDSDDDFDPSQLLFAQEDIEDTQPQLNPEPSEAPAILNLQDFIKANDAETRYAPLSLSEIKAPNPAREILNHMPLQLKNSMPGGTIYKKSFDDRRFTAKVNSNPNIPIHDATSKATGAQPPESRRGNSLFQGHPQRPPSQISFREEPGSIYLKEINHEEPVPAHRGLGEALLSSKPSRRNMNGGTSFLGQKQKFKDVPFLLLYAGFALFFFVVNIIVIFKSSQSSFEKYASGSVFLAIKKSLLAVTITLIVSVLVGLAWLVSICSITKPLLWFTFLSIPAASFLIFILMLTRGFIGFGYQSEYSDPAKQSKILSLIPLSVAIIHSFIIHRYHTSIRQAIEIIRMSGIILRNNFDLIGASLCCLASHILFSAVWLISFDRLFLLGHEDTISGKKTWLSDDSLYFLVPFYFVFFFWTSNIINNVERCTIAGTVSQWYFHQDSNNVNGYNPTKVALRRSLTTSFGSLSLAGLIMTVIRILKFARSTYEKNSSGTGLASIGLRLVLSPMMFAARAVEGISFFTVSYIGISGKPFLKSAQVASTILSRNFFHCLLANYVIRATIYSCIVTISTLTGFAFFSFSADSLKTSHTFVVGSLGISISFFVLKFMMNILLYTTDAVYLCYGIDVDQKTNHYAHAHRTLSKYN